MNLRHDDDTLIALAMGDRLAGIVHDRSGLEAERWLLVEESIADGTATTVDEFDTYEDAATALAMYGPEAAEVAPITDLSGQGAELRPVITFQLEDDGIGVVVRTADENFQALAIFGDEIEVLGDWSDPGDAIYDLTRAPRAAVTDLEAEIQWPCPVCNAATIPIVYGLPGTGMWEQAKRGEIAIGGCVLEPDAPTRECPDCQQQSRSAEVFPDLETALRALTEPLFTAGWVLDGTDSNWGRDEGHSLSFLLDRDGGSLEVALYDDGTLVVWPTGDEDKDEPTDGDVSIPIAELSAASIASCSELFQAQGWTP